MTDTAHYGKRWTRLLLESRTFMLSAPEERLLWPNRSRLRNRWSPQRPSLAALSPERALRWAFSQLRTRQQNGMTSLWEGYGAALHGDEWLEVLRANAHDDDALVIALAELEAFGPESVPRLGRAVDEVFGVARAVSVGAGLIASDRLPRRLELVRWLATHPTAPTDALLHALRDRDSEVRGAAAAGLRRHGPAAVPQLFAMLRDPAAPAREGAALALRFIGGPEAVEPLKQALATETVRFVAVALRRAAHYCDPSTTGPPPDEVVHFGDYPLATKPETSAVMSELRELLHDDEQSPESWVRLCNVVERLRTANGLSVAQDYLGYYGVEAWKLSWRSLPFEWQADPALSALCLRSPQSPEWLTLESRVAGRMEPFLMAIQRRANLTPTEDGRRLFLDAVQVGWQFCREHGVHPSRLRVDVAWVFANERGVRERLELQLFRGFGLRVDATRSPHPGDIGTGGASLSTFHVELPADHPLLRTFPTGPHRALDLTDMLTGRP